MVRKILSSVLVIGLAGATGAGCSDGSRRNGGGLASTIAAATSGTTAGTTSSSTTTAGAQTQDPVGPELTVSSPARGTFTTARRVAVEGSATDLGSGVAEVHVNGRTAQLSSGSFREQVDLEPGLNTIVVEAWDVAQNRTERHVSIIAGDTADETQALTEAASVRLSDAALDLIEPMIARGVETQKPAIAQRVLSTRINSETTAKSFDFGAVHASIDAANGGLRFEVTIDNVALGIEHRARFLLVFRKTHRGTVTAQQVRLQGTALVMVQNGQATARVQQLQATTVGFDVPSWADSARGQIQQMFEQQLAAESTTALNDALGQALRSTSGNVTRTILGKPLRVDYALTTLAFDEAGCTAVFAGNVAAGTATVGQQTGSFAVRGAIAPLTALTGGATIGGAVHQDALNRALHAAWRAGAFRFTLNQQTLAALSPQASATLPLDTSALIALAPDLARVLTPGLPIELEIDAALPPVVRCRPGQPQPMEVAIGDLRVRIMIPTANGAKLPLADAVYAVRAEVGLVERAGRVFLDVSGRTTILVDAESQGIPGVERMLEAFTRTAGPQLLASTLASQGGFAVPAVQGITASSLQFGANGVSLVAVGVAQAARPTP